MVIVQQKNGPCGVLACIQAYMLIHSHFDPKTEVSDFNPAEWDKRLDDDPFILLSTCNKSCGIWSNDNRRVLLSKAIASIIKRSAVRCHRIGTEERDYFVLLPSSYSSNCDYVHTLPMNMSQQVCRYICRVNSKKKEEKVITWFKEKIIIIKRSLSLSSSFLRSLFVNVYKKIDAEKHLDNT